MVYLLQVKRKKCLLMSNIRLDKKYYTYSFKIKSIIHSAASEFMMNLTGAYWAGTRITGTDLIIGTELKTASAQKQP